MATTTKRVPRKTGVDVVDIYSTRISSFFSFQKTNSSEINFRISDKLARVLRWAVHRRPLSAIVESRKSKGSSAKLCRNFVEFRATPSRAGRASLIPEFINYTVHAEDIYYVGYKLQLRLPYKRTERGSPGRNGRRERERSS